MTLVEMIVATTITLIILSLVMSILASNRQTRAEDQRMNDSTQNLRVAQNLLSTDITRAGEGIRLTRFPVVQLRTQTTPTGLSAEPKLNSSILTFKLKDKDPKDLNLDLPILRVCNGIDTDKTRDDAGNSRRDAKGNFISVSDSDTSTDNSQYIDVALVDNTNPAATNRTELEQRIWGSITQMPDCARTDNDGNGKPDNWEAWQRYRQYEADGTVRGNQQLRAYITDGLGNGQFFTFIGEDCFDKNGVSQMTNNCSSAIRFSLVKQNDGTPDGANFKYDYGFEVRTAAGLTTAPPLSNVVVNRVESEVHLQVKEYRYTLSNAGNLQLQIDTDDYQKAQQLVGDIDKFNAEVLYLQDITQDRSPILTSSTFPIIASPQYNWKDFRGIKVYLKSKDPNAADNIPLANQDYHKRLESVRLFLPRNVASCSRPC